jgi:IQ domain-containing protein D
MLLIPLLVSACESGLASKHLSEEEMRVAREHRKLETRFAADMQMQSRMATPLATDPEPLADSSRALRESARNLCRILASHPTLAAELAAKAPPRSQGIGSYLENVLLLKSVLLEKLLVSADEDRERAAYMAQIAARHKRSAEDVARLQAELGKIREESNEEIEKRETVIRKLKNDIQTVKLSVAQQLKQLEQDAASAEDRKQNEHGDFERTHGEHTSQLQQELRALQARNRESELHLRKRRFKLETEVENWISKYDQEMSEKQDELEVIREIYQDEKRQLAELEERFAKLKTQYDAVMEQRKRDEEERVRTETEHKAKTAAAVRIQSSWRGFVVRKKLKEKKAKKGKKGKKGGSGSGSKGASAAAASSKTPSATIAKSK